jgi:hypothetical protein
LYSGFNHLLHKNAFSIIKYISTCNTDYIAKHFLTQTKLRKDSNGNYPGFRAEVEKGDEMCVPGKVASSEENTEKWFQLMGDSYIFEWIIDIAQAIP